MFLIINAFPLFLICIPAILSIEASNWWSYWMIIEINSVGFIIFLLAENSNEKVFVFFLFQTLSSLLLITYIFFNSWTIEQNIVSSANTLAIMSVVLNIGIFPFDGWIVNIGNTLSWNSIMLLITWQNLIPTIIFFKLCSNSNTAITFLLASIVALSINITMVSNINSLIIISSLVHNSWMLLPISNFNIVSILYLIVYSLISIPIINNLSKNNINSINSQTPTNNSNKEIIALVVSLSGIPPSVIFFINISVIIVVIEESKNMLLLTAIIASSCITFYIYFQMFVNIFSIETLPSNNTLSPGGNNTNEVSWILLSTPLIIWL